MIKGMQEVIDVMTKAKADLDKNGGLKQVIFVACGGSFASSYPARFLLNQGAELKGQRVLVLTLAITMWYAGCMTACMK